MERLPTYEQLYTSFRWNIPARYNIAADVWDRHAADPSKIALIGERADGGVWRMPVNFEETIIDTRGPDVAIDGGSVMHARGDPVMAPWHARGCRLGVVTTDR